MKQIHFYIFIGLLLVLPACKKLDLSPIDRYSELTFWTSAERADLFVNTIYNQMIQSGSFFYDEALSDNAYTSRGDASGSNSIPAGLADASGDRFKNQWNDMYKCIRTCNTFLEHVEEVPDYDAAIKKTRIAEVRFIRAYQHYYLINYYGDVPLVTKTLTIEESRSIARTPRAQVLDFVLSELDAAAADLPVNTALNVADRGRITRGAATAFKARVYLYEGQWQQVISITDQFMTGSEYGTYGLFPSYAGLFLPENEYNSEVILDNAFVPVKRTHSEHFDFVPMTAKARLNALAPTQELVNSYIMLNGKAITEAGSGYNETDPYKNRDPRMDATLVHHRSSWTLTDGTTVTIYTQPGSTPAGEDAADEYSAAGISSRTGYYFRKYYDPTYTGTFNSGLNLILIRYADILMMHAEAKAELGQMSAAVWDQTIRPIRSRAGFTDAGALSYPGGDIKNSIRNERRSEFAFESLRIYDIKRWRTGPEVLNGWVHGAKYGTPDIDNGYLRVGERKFNATRQYLWAIPRSEREANGNLTQNPGW